MYSLKLKIEFIDRELYPNWGQGCAIVDFGRCRGWKVIHSLSSSLLHLQQSPGWGVSWVIYKSTADQLQSTDSYYNCKTSINLFENTCICNMITIWIWNWMFFLHEEKKICTDFCYYFLDPMDSDGMCSFILLDLFQDLIAWSPC